MTPLGLPDLLSPAIQHLTEALMSNALPRPAPIDIDDYLDGETRCEIKHEYLDGEVVAMGGASARPIAMSR